MELFTVVCGPLDVNCHLLAEGGACAAIDPADAQPVLDLLEEKKLTLTHILLTHGHFDHILGVAALKERTGAAVLIHEADAGMLSSGTKSFAALAGAQQQPAQADTLLHGGEVILPYRLSVLHTPGHSAGSVCYIHEESRMLFSGDTLFRLSIGRTDLPGGDKQALYRSIHDGLFALEGNYTVYPGHMRATELDFERRHNPYMRRHTDEW